MVVRLHLYPGDAQSFYPSEYKENKRRARYTPVCAPLARPRCCRAEELSTHYCVELALFLTLPFALIYAFFSLVRLRVEEGWVRK